MFLAAALTIPAAVPVAASESTADKEETVYVKTDANGEEKSVIVSDWLKNFSGEAKIKDATDLTDVENVKGNETYKRGKKNNITWNANGNDIYYQGSSDKNLPVSMKVTYYLDGKEIKPKDLIGKSGKVKIHYEYENHSEVTKTINGKQTTIYTPFTMITAAILNTDNFSNVKAKNGKVISDGSKHIVIGVAMPGLADSLNLKNTSIGSNFDIPEDFEITADVEDFQMTVTATVANSDTLSEFGLNYNNVYRSVDNYWRNNWETFRYEDGSSFTRVEDGIPSRISTYGHNIGLNYSFQDQGKWFFNSTVRWAFNKNKQNNQSSLYILEKPEEILMMKEHSTGRTSRPSVDLYFQCKLNNDQSLIINAVTTYIDTQSDRSYTEGKSNEPLTDIYSTVSGNKYSFIGEGIYERKVTKKSRLSAGVKYQQSLADNTYGGNESSETKMHETHATAYVEYSGKMDRFNYSFGLQGSYARFKQKEEGYNRYSLLPRLRLGYQFSDNVFIRYRGQISRKSPGLSDMGNVRQLIDSLQVRSGNPELKIFTVYKNELEADFRKGLFSGNVHLSYQYQHRPIMEETIRDKNNSFVRTNANQLSWQKLNPELELKLGPLKDILTFSFSTGINYYDSRGLDYHHTYTNWYYRAEVMASYKRWSGFFQMENHRNNFYGETLSYGESFHTLGLSYRYKRLNIGMMTLNPFVDNYRMGGEMFSKVAPSKNWWYVKESCRLFVAKVSWNISFGRKYETMQKRVNNEDSNAGTLKSGK